jgi:FkbM family methyltransferase
VWDSDTLARQGIRREADLNWPRAWTDRLRGLRRGAGRRRRRLAELRRAGGATTSQTAFMVREWRAAGGTERVGLYRIAGTPADTFIRHGSPDVWSLWEVFVDRVYLPPPAAAARVEACARGRPIIDAGAYVGHFALYALTAFPGRPVRSFEPDDENLDVLFANRALNGHLSSWSVERAAVAAGAGRGLLAGGRDMGSHLVDGGAGHEPEEGVSEVEIRDFFELAAGAALVKLDIEGAEWRILADPRLRALDAPVIALEWHRRGAADGEAAADAFGLLHRADYAVVRHTPDRSGETGLLWAVRGSR